MQKYTLDKNSKLNQRYQIIRSIGQGGFGITYIAEDKTLNQYVVIKEYFPVILVARDEVGMIILPETSEEKMKYQEGMKRFLNEAKILASLFDVPGVVKVLDYFQENQTAYIVMEHVKGISLRRYLEQMEEELSFAKVCEMLKPVMLALEKIHAKGLLHRDISPDNLMVEEDGKIKILDFGSAREYFMEHDKEKTLTILVKNGYAPLEQYESKGRQGPWTDIYALCATMYEMMTGCMPPNAKERAIKDELYAPSTYEVNIEIEQEEAFLNKGLALYTENRYQNVRELLDDCFLDDRIEKLEKKSKKKVLCLAGCMITLIVAATVYFYYHIQPKAPDYQYAGSFERGSQEYEQFMDFVKENAVREERKQTEDGSEFTRYSLERVHINEINIPSNANTFELTIDAFVEELLDEGIALNFVSSEETFEVEDYGYGALRTNFLVKKDFQTSNSVCFEICHDYISKEIVSIKIYNQKKEEADYTILIPHIMGILVPYLDEEISLENIRELQEEFAKNSNGDNSYLIGFETREIGLNFFWTDESTDPAAAICAEGFSNVNSPYKW